MGKPHKVKMFKSMVFWKKKEQKTAALSVFNKSSTLDGRSSTPKDFEKSFHSRRGSVPVVPHTSMKEQEDSLSVDGSTHSSNKLTSFFSKRGFKSNLKRTKSVTKLDRKKFTNSDLESYGTESDSSGRKLVNSLKRSMSLGRIAKRWQPRTPDPSDKSKRERALIQARMRTSRSHESLLVTASSMHSIDLSGPDVEIKPLHSSILGQEHCFQVSTSHGSKFYSCRSAQEREKWIQSLRKTVKPNQEQSRRTDISLQLWILEGKNVMPKKRYYCDLALDKTLYARTSSKVKGDMLFWGEQFEFNNLPEIDVVSINLFREVEKKKKKDKNALVGYVHIPCKDISGRQFIEKWYTASSATVGRAGKDIRSDLPLLRVKARYQTISILPMDNYREFSQYLMEEYTCLVDALEPLISVKAKEDIASCLVAIMQKMGRAKDFLHDIVMAEVSKLDNEHLTFRGNSIATKAMEAYMKLVGHKYMQDTLGDCISSILDSQEDFEVDPAKIQNLALLKRQQETLVMYSQMVWCKIINSHAYFPIEIREVFASLKEGLVQQQRGDLSENLISSCIFLRFLCPAILSPSLFNLIQEYPDEKGARNLTLVTKTIQTLANFSKFGGKEEFMKFMNDFVDQEWGSMKTFLRQITSLEYVTNASRFDGYIDLGKELSLLHNLLVECLVGLNQDTQKRLSRLKQILEDLTEEHTNPGSLPRGTKSSYLLYDNIMNTCSHCVSQGKRDSAQSSSSTASGSYSPDYATLNNGPIRRPPSGGSLPKSPSSSECQHKGRFSGVEEGPHNVSIQVGRTNPDSVNQSWNKIVYAAETSCGDFVDLISLTDPQEETRSLSGEWENASQVSSGPSSNNASSGYHSLQYSQSSSPIDSGLHPEAASQEAHRPAMPQPLSFANPLFRHQASHKMESRRKSRNSSSSSVSSSEAPTIDKLRSVSEKPPRMKKLDSASSSSSESLSVASSERYHSDGPVNKSRQSQDTRAVEAMFDGRSLGSATMHKTFAGSPYAVAELSRSAEFTPIKEPLEQGRMKRTATDTLLLQTASPVFQHEVLPSNASSLETRSLSQKQVSRPNAPQSSVRMGVRSVQRKLQDQDKSKTEFEQEVRVLRQQLAEKENILARLEVQLTQEEQKRTKQNEEYSCQLQRTQEQQKEKEQQMQAVISRFELEI